MEGCAHLLELSHKSLKPYKVNFFKLEKRILVKIDRDIGAFSVGQRSPGPKIIKHLFILNSLEHEISTTHKKTIVWFTRIGSILLLAKKSSLFKTGPEK